MKQPSAALHNLGFLCFCVVSILLGLTLPDIVFDPSSQVFILSIGAIALWRYLWSLTHYFRALIYIHFAFPKWRKAAENISLSHSKPEETYLPKLYFLITFFRIKTDIAARCFHAVVQEALNSSGEVMITVSIVEAQDEELLTSIFNGYDLPDRIALHIVRVEGKGKRYGLAQALRTISRDMPEPHDLCVIMDGDTVLSENSIKRCAPFFKSMPDLGALTTDELSVIDDNGFMRDWHELRFAQRHILMASLALSRRVMTLTGRMSMFRASIVTQADFITHMEDDHLDHWRLGRIKFLTGDDKSSLYYLMKAGYAQIYVPDVKVFTLEDPPSNNFLSASTQLMLRWFGNMLRTNARMLRLGVEKMPVFVWWCFLDQRLSMWTTFSGPVFAFMLFLRYGAWFVMYYIVWILIVRIIMSLMLIAARPYVTWRYPLLLYYNQVFAAVLKIWMLFHLNKQRWTRQNTQFVDHRARAIFLWQKYSSLVTLGTSCLVIVMVIGCASSILTWPDSFLRDMMGLFGGL